MKKKLSISIDSELIGKLDKKLAEGFFRNKSHIVEFALNRLIANDLADSNDLNKYRKAILEEKK